MRLWDALLDAMRTVRTPRLRRIGAREAERLLTGWPTGADRHELRRVLNAVAAPAQPGELAGEAAVVAAFARAHLAPGPAQPPRRRVLGPALTRAVALKVLVGVAVLSVGGTAVAAGSGRLPTGLQRQAHDLFAPLGVPAPASPPSEGRHGGTSRGAGNGPTLPATVPGPDGTPGPDASAGTPLSLCRAYALSQKNKNKPMDAASLRALAVDAGGEANIPAYCAAVLAGTPGAGSSPGPSNDRPTGQPDRDPHGKPSDRPTPHGRPSAKG
jgi:hypothetical protein